MAKEVGIKIKLTSEGQEIVVRNLVELETELLKLQEILKTQTFGSKEFAETAANISKLKGQIEDVDKAIEGLGAERRFQAITAAVGVAVNSFQALSGVVGLFATNSEDLEKIQKAEAQALQVLNIALGVNNVLLDLQEAKKLKDIVITKAQTIATNAAALATRVWNAVLSANPIALVITAVAALTTAIILFSKETEKSAKGLDKLKIETDELNKVNEEAVKIRDKELEKIIPLITLTESETISKKDRNRAIKEIQKDYPSYLKNQDLEKLTLQDIKKANEDLITSMEKLARSRAAMNSLTEIYQEELKIEEGLQKAAQSREETLQRLYAVGDASQVEGQRKVNEGLEKIANDNARRQRQELEIRKNVIKGFVDTEDAVKQLTGEVDKNTQAVDKNLITLQRQTNILNQYAKLISKVRGDELKFESDLLDRQNKVIEDQTSLIDKRSQTFISNSKKVREEIKSLFFDIIPDDPTLKQLDDNFRNLFKTTEALRFNFKNLSADAPLLDIQPEVGFDELVKRVLEVSRTLTDEQLKNLDLTREGIENIGDTLTGVNEETKLSFLEYFNTLDDRLNIIRKTIKESFGGAGLIELDLVNIEDLRSLEKEIAFNIANRIKSGESENAVLEKNNDLIARRLGLDDNLKIINQTISQETIKLNEAILSGNEEQIKKSNDIISTYSSQKTAIEGVVQAILNQVAGTNSFILAVQKVGEESDKNLKKIQQFRKDLTKPITPEELEGVSRYFEQNADNFESILEDIFENTDKYFEKFGEDGIKAIFSGLEKGLPEVEGQTREELENIINELQIFGDLLADSFKLPENPFKKYIEDATKELKKLPTASEEAFKETIDNLNDIADTILRVFTDISGRLQTILQTQTSMLLEELQYEQEATLALIGEANTESAAENARIIEEQEKAQKKFAKARFEIEKKARVQELQFGLANAIASSAQAVIQALALPAPPPIPQLYAGVVGGLSAAQILLIREQLQTAQSRTFIGRRGGLIMGESHEGSNGGVPALLEGGEFVMSRPAVDAYGDILGSINSSVGGRALQIDDSRIVQAISSQNTSKTPIKTYVLYNDIQSTDKLNKKIENLAKL